MSGKKSIEEFFGFLGRGGLPHFWSRGGILLFLLKKSYYFLKIFFFRDII